jgi:transcriptional regulator with XRE-family HTH domain
MVASMFTAAHRELFTAVVEMRKRAGMTQRQLADSVGREQNYIGRIETGQRRIDLVEWVGICRACGVDPEVEIAKLVKRIVGLVPRRPRTA